MKKFSSLILTLMILAPVTAAALEGIGPRVTASGTIGTVTITKEQKFQEYGGEFTLKATNGQIVTVLLNKNTRIIAEGRISRKDIVPENLQPNMDIRVRGWRLGTSTINASLVILTNVSLNPALTTSGTLQSIDGSSITVIGQDQKLHTYLLTPETEVTINYSLRGIDAMSLIGKEVLLTLNPTNQSYLRSLRITGNKERVLIKPTTLQLGRPR